MDLKRQGIPMDTPHGRERVPAAEHRLHGADRSGIGQKGWAEVPDDLIGHPDDTNVPRDWFEPPSDAD
ncbi:MAG: hypothetical protein AB7H66_07060 [Hyphomonadaceae bacterium]